MSITRKRIWYLVGFLAIVTCVLWLYIGTQAPGTSNILTVAMLDIGQGDSIYVRAPDGHQMLIDGGPRGSLMKPLSDVVPYGTTSIDVLMITNADADHYAGYLDFLKTYEIGAVVEAGVPSKTKTYAEFEALIKEKHIQEVNAKKGMQIVLDEKDGVVFNVLYPDRDVAGWKTNDASIMGRLVYGSRSVMFTGDAPSTTESLVIAGNPPGSLKSDILKVGHHGSRTSTSNAFIEAVSPIQAIISAGNNNRYGHPTPETLARLKAHNIPIFVTKDVGTITCTTDGIVQFICKGGK
jgi:competence protein ComEC